MPPQTVRTVRPNVRPARNASAWRVLAVLATLLSSAPMALADELGTERWRVELGAPVAADPVVGPGGRIAVLTPKALVVLSPTGGLEAAYTDVALPAQPFWSGESLWYRTAAGWKVAGSESACEVVAGSGVALPEGTALFAPRSELVRCGAEREVVGRRRGAEARLLPMVDGFVSVDLSFAEFLSSDFRAHATRPLAEWGTPVGVGRAGLFVASQSARIDFVDRRGNPLWRGVPAVGGVPVETAAGGLVLLGDRGVSLAVPPFVAWSVPIAAGVRSAAVLESGAVAVLERTGAVGIVQDGSLIWGRRLTEPGPVLVAHPAGLLLVVEGTSLVAIAAPRPEGGDVRPRCEPPGDARVDGKRLSVEGPTLRDGESCRRPVLTTSCEKPGCRGVGTVLFSAACGPGCAAAMHGNELTILDGKSLRRVDANGRVRTRRSPLPRSDVASTGPAPIHLAIGSDGSMVVRRGQELVFLSERGQPVRRALAETWLAGPIVVRGRAVGVDAKRRLVSLGRGDERERVVRTRPRPGDPVAVPRLLAFGETVCMEARDHTGCAAEGNVLPPMSLAARTMLFGQAVRTCADGTSLCWDTPLATEPEALLWTAEGRIDAVEALGDGTLAALVDGRRVVGLWPNGSVRWSLDLGSEACDTGWLARVGDRLVAKGCGRVVQIALR